jgi:hypothetical protein
MKRDVSDQTSWLFSRADRCEVVIPARGEPWEMSRNHEEPYCGTFPWSSETEMTHLSSRRPHCFSQIHLVRTRNNARLRTQRWIPSPRFKPDPSCIDQAR